MVKKDTKRAMASCPIVAFNDLVAGKHKLRIMWEVRGRPVRFGAIRRALVTATDGRTVTARVLSRELKELQAAGLISRHQYPGVPPKVEYSMTDGGRLFMPVMRAICRWRIAHDTQNDK